MPAHIMKRAGKVLEHPAGSHQNPSHRKGSMANANSSELRSAPKRRALNVDAELRKLRKMSVDQLREKWLEVFGESTNGRHKQWLIKRIIWRMQANAEGDLSQRARARANEIANDADLRNMPPRAPKESTGTKRTVPAPNCVDSRIPGVGQVITRQYKGREIVVEVTKEGFTYDGGSYRSLTAVANAVTGKHWNGFHFFGLKKRSAK